jgi:N-acetylglucosaminyldiphosphoundecaprenol N-acetyl-beta-D-mannosaminyltransferase
MALGPRFRRLRLMKKMHVLTAPLLVTDYTELAQACLAWARQPQCRLLEFVNTQIVTMRRHDGEFRDTMDAYDELVPDGMPLVWCLNRAGAKLRDRVYGPTFMRRFLETMPEPTTHYLLGGSEACGARLQEMFTQQNPNVKFIGAYHGWCQADGTLTGAAETEVLAELNRLGPDFIWVGFGTPKQQAWARRHKHLIHRGVVLTVGFAFDANAGMKPDAPAWLQRLGLTWLYRMLSEPRRLFPRYCKWNSLFLYYLLRDGFRGRAWGRFP